MGDIEKPPKEVHRRIFQCAICLKYYANHRSFRYHSLTSHSDIIVKRYKCEECGKRFASRSSRDSHMLLHSGELPFACELCGQRFRYNGNLKKHKLTHERRLKKEEAQKVDLCSTIRLDSDTEEDGIEIEEKFTPSGISKDRKEFDKKPKDLVVCQEPDPFLNPTGNHVTRLKSDGPLFSKSPAEWAASVSINMDDVLRRMKTAMRSSYHPKEITKNIDF
ncbi:hypothetical protein QR680_019010 [Steinernema hermaphroditum]|uniref:C2H2-type domain-containing protein n=1 Tax=Steinernema hermaphroditum TaxID=289476 RepID=A0AA39LRQ1_9BILA|nr:hypothetical protein QR680_019010 [Steinernema hermaphroditum]